MGKSNKKQNWKEKRENAKKVKVPKPYDQTEVNYENALLEEYYKVISFKFTQFTFQNNI